MKKGFVFSIVLILMFSISLIAAPNNTNNTQQSGTLTCTEDYECPQGKECENNVCVLDEEDEESHENKVCCKISKTDTVAIELEYELEDEEDCVSTDTKNKEIVENSFCTQNREEEQEREREGYTYEEKHRISNNGNLETKISDCPVNCLCTGSSIKCETEDGREMTIMAGNSGNVIIQSKEFQASTRVALYKNNDTFYGNFSNETKKINIYPDQVREKIRERLKQQDCECEDLELDEEGYYQVQTKKKARLFWLIPVREQVKAQVEVEYGEIKIRNPWWGFLANDIEEEN